MAEKDPFDLSGVTIDGKYRVASVVGDGGFGVVYRGVHKGFGELIAVKCLKVPQDLDEPGRAELLEKLQDEGRLLHRLSKATSGIVQALDVGAFTTTQGRWVPYLVLEWLEGETLGQHLKDREARGEGGMSLEDAIRLLSPAARALGIAHQQKIAHRDVKPANLFLSEVGGKRTAKVLDFGIAKVLSDHVGMTTALESTAQAATAFTPRYGAPEQFNKQRGATGPWTDVFALALVLVECVSGRKALLGDDPTQLYVASADPAIRPTLRACGVEATDAVERVLEKALAVEPKLRFSDVGSFWSALEAAAGVEGSDTLPEGVGLRGPSSADDATRVEASGAPSAKPSPKAMGGLGPTLPAESLRQGAPKRRRAVDPMAETPAGDRKSAASTSLPAHLEPKAGGGAKWVAPVLAIGLFVGGGAFAWSTLTGTGEGGAAPSSSTKPTAKPPARASSAPRASASATATASASAAPSAELPDAGAPTDPHGEDMVKLRGASFAMGEVGAITTITKDVWIDRQEVTVRAYRACVASGSCTAAEVASRPDDAEYGATWTPRCNGARKADDHPQNCVTWAQADAYCRAQGRRLPTEAEWELAARGARGRRYAWGGGAPACDAACYDRNAGCREHAAEVSTCPSGSFANDRTDDLLFDLAGNVSEWTADAFGDLPGGDDPKRTDGNGRVVRGGNFFDGPEALVATHRVSVPPDAALATVGFRCAAD